MNTYDWMGTRIEIGQRVTVCAATVGGFPHGLVVGVRHELVAVMVDGLNYPIWFRGEQIVIDETEA